MQNLIVLHFLGGEIIRGSTSDFFPDKKWFHFTDKDTGQTMKIDFGKLKGIFFVKDFEGSPEYQERYDIGRKGLGKKVKVSFKDGETIFGYTTGISPGRTGFFLFPSDPFSNTDKIFVIDAATEEVQFV